jgi:hypothetical protein
VSDLASAIVGAMLWLAPPSGATEPAQDTVRRYWSIADDAIAVTDGDTDAISIILGIASHESGFSLGVDSGERRGAGVDSCLLQIRVGRGRTAEGWTHEDLVGDRRKCFIAGWRLARQSLGACRHLPHLERLSAYASGACSRGRAASRVRMRTAVKIAWMLLANTGKDENQ